MAYGLDYRPDNNTDDELNKKRDDNLRAMFQAPLLSDAVLDETDNIKLPERDFHVVKTTQPQLGSSEQIREFDQLIAEVPHDLDVIIDMSPVTYINAEALQMLVMLNKNMKRNDRIMYVATTQKAVLEKFATTRLDGVIKIRGSTQEAYKEIFDTAI
ncbi:MAG: STAS domain-containing protein [Candidatus Peribacteraceae bacterium]|jgi:anti-anti-sigma factor|nr:STAS domain-containing protein [Candidatus Peribacteraceae bacterium]MDP7477358.1 STAS domain-containing protein [Candidatus Peribacteraceae bacterium]